jgi:hypothetical protein
MRVFPRLTVRSYSFLGASIALGIDVAIGVLLLVRHLDHMSFGATGCLVAGILLLVQLWRFTIRRHETISALSATEASTQKTVDAVLAASVETMQQGLLLVSIVVLLFLEVIIQMFANR